MVYFGVQFRMARAAANLGVRDVSERVSMSFRTLAAIEAADEIRFGVKLKGCFEEATIAKLVTLYRECGVTFVEPSSKGTGVLYRSKPRRT